MINEPSSHLQKHLFKSSRENVQLAQEENENVEWRNTRILLQKDRNGEDHSCPENLNCQFACLISRGGGGDYCGGTVLSF